MERLTKYLASGAADYNYPAGCYSGNDCNDRVAKSAYRQTCVERLAAYEETGLTPEESKRMSNILMDVGIDYNCSWEYVKNWLLDDRLRELDEADKDGRVVVLPCKDCKYYNPDEYECGCDFAGGLPYIKPDDFCSYGEPKEG